MLDVWCRNTFTGRGWSAAFGVPPFAVLPDFPSHSGAFKAPSLEHSRFARSDRACVIISMKRLVAFFASSRFPIYPDSSVSEFGFLLWNLTTHPSVRFCCCAMHSVLEPAKFWHCIACLLFRVTFPSLFVAMHHLSGPSPRPLVCFHS